MNIVLPSEHPKITGFYGSCDIPAYQQRIEFVWDTPSQLCATLYVPGHVCTQKISIEAANHILYRTFQPRNTYFLENHSGKEH